MTAALPEPAAIALRNVRWGPQKRPDILAGIGFSLAPGQILALCGAEGAGKSALLRILSRQVAPRGGAICLFGRDLWLMSPEEAARMVAMTPDQPPDLSLTVREAVSPRRLPQFQGGEAPTLAEENAMILSALDRMGLLEVAGHCLYTLDGAARQKVVLARLLAQRPRLVLLGAPADPAEAASRAALTRRLRGTGLTVVMALEDADLAHGVADRRILLREGRIVADETCAPLRPVAAPPPVLARPGLVRDVALGA